MERFQQERKETKNSSMQTNGAKGMGNTGKKEQKEDEAKIRKDDAQKESDMKINESRTDKEQMIEKEGNNGEKGISITASLPLMKKREAKVNPDCANGTEPPTKNDIFKVYNSGNIAEKTLNDRKLTKVTEKKGKTKKKMKEARSTRRKKVR